MRAIEDQASSVVEGTAIDLADRVRTKVWIVLSLRRNQTFKLFKFRLAEAQEATVRAVRAFDPNHRAN